MQELITAAKRVQLCEAFRIAKRKRTSGMYICPVLTAEDNHQEAVDEIDRRLGSETLGTYMYERGMKSYRGFGSQTFNSVRNLWLNMLINEHSSYGMYLLARYRDYLINLRDRGFTTSCPTIVSGFAQWCVNKFDADYYDWLIKERKSKKLWQRIRNQECCPELQEFIHQEILEVTNILIQEPK